MTEDLARALLSEIGRALIADAETLLASGSDSLPALLRLRKTASPELAAAAWEQAALRRRAVVKFGADASRMYFVREALEQASSALAASYHAARFVEAGVKDVADLCGGIGGDALAFARAGLRVDLYEYDPARALFAAENARACGFTEQITAHRADITVTDITCDAVWFDPARRSEGRRAVSPDDYLPPLSFIRSLGCRYVGVKVAPAIDHALADMLDADLEFLSDSGECKEALLWMGEFRKDAGVRATVLTSTPEPPARLGSLSPLEQGDGLGPSLTGGFLTPPPYLRRGLGGGSVLPSTSTEENSYSLSFPKEGVGRRYTLTGKPDSTIIAGGLGGRYLYEPDPAVIRAHLVGALGAQIAAAPFDPQIAYLLGNEYISTPFATAYEVLEQFPYHRKALQRALTSREIGSVVIKKRGFPEEPEAVRKGLRLTGPNHAVIVLSRIGNKHIAFLCRTVEETARRVSNDGDHGDS